MEVIEEQLAGVQGEMLAVKEDLQCLSPLEIKGGFIVAKAVLIIGTNDVGVGRSRKSSVPLEESSIGPCIGDGGNLSQKYPA